MLDVGQMMMNSSNEVLALIIRVYAERRRKGRSWAGKEGMKRIPGNSVSGGLVFGHKKGRTGYSLTIPQGVMACRVSRGLVGGPVEFAIYSMCSGKLLKSSINICE